MAVDRIAGQDAEQFTPPMLPSSGRPRSLIVPCHPVFANTSSDDFGLLFPHPKPKPRPQSPQPLPLSHASAPRSLLEQMERSPTGSRWGV